MSFWFRGKDKRGRVHYWSVTIPLLPIIALLGILIALFFSCVRWLREFLQ